MTTRIKRTYNLSADAVAHVRDLAGRGQLPASQDGVVEMAIERLYRDERDREEAESWERAANDPVFMAEAQAIDAAYAAVEVWPE